MVLEHDEWKPGQITTVANRPAEFQSGNWYSMRLDVIGNQGAVTANGVNVSGSPSENRALPARVAAIARLRSQPESRVEAAISGFYALAEFGCHQACGSCILVVEVEYATVRISLPEVRQGL